MRNDWYLVNDPHLIYAHSSRNHRHNSIFSTIVFVQPFGLSHSLSSWPAHWFYPKNGTKKYHFYGIVFVCAATCMLILRGNFGPFSMELHFMLLIASSNLIASRTFSWFSANRHTDIQSVRTHARTHLSGNHLSIFPWPKRSLLYHNILLADLCVVGDRVVVVRFDKIIIHVAICVRMRARCAAIIITLDFNKFVPKNYWARWHGFLVDN